MAGEPEVECYIDNAGEHRMHVMGGNGEPMIGTLEGYSSEQACDDAIIKSYFAMGRWLEKRLLGP
jgi:uncharacterized protein YegP (UPF0339 family)